MTDAELRVLEDVTEYAAECASERDERPHCIKAACAVITAEQRMRRLMDAPACHGVGCPACQPSID